MRAHTEFTGGHLGIRKTQDQVRRLAYWKGWRDDVHRYCERCSECTRYHIPPRQSPFQRMTVEIPWE